MFKFIIVKKVPWGFFSIHMSKHSSTKSEGLTAQKYYNKEAIHENIVGLSEVVFN